jgi:hypothetical protein
VVIITHKKTKNLNDGLQLKDETAYAGLGFFAKGIINGKESRISTHDIRE